MKKLFCISVAGLALAACGGEPAATNETAAAEPVDALLPGNFEITTTVERLASTDGSTPATSTEDGSTTTTNLCVGEDGVLPAAAYGEEGDDCTVENPYARRGRLSQTLVCQRAGRGELRHSVDASFTGESIEGNIVTETTFTTDGDYRLIRNVTATRTGDCTEAEAAEDLEAEA